MDLSRMPRKISTRNEKFRGKKLEMPKEKKKFVVFLAGF
jgi:hypothetical protein